MAISIGDLLGVWNQAEKFVDYLSRSGTEDQILQVRKALRTFKFSDQSVRALRELCQHNASTDPEYLVGQIAVQQRDSRKAFSDAADVLLQFSYREDISIRGEDLVNKIVWGKTTIRAELKKFLLEAYKLGAKDEMMQILIRVEGLNRRIVELDNKLGGIILDNAD